MRTELARLFVATTPPEFWRRTILCLDKACAQSYEVSRGLLSWQEAMTVRPILRRGIVEDRWRALAEQFPDVSAEAKLNQARNQYHTEVRTGQFLITESKVEESGMIARPTAFRKGHAATGQMALAMYDELLVFEGIQYAILQYGPVEREPWRLEFAEVVFVTPDYGAELDRIDLLAQYGQPSTTDAVEAVAAPGVALRGDVRKEKDQA